MLLTVDILPCFFSSKSSYESCLEYILLCGVIYSYINLYIYIYTGFTLSPVTHLKLYELL